MRGGPGGWSRAAIRAIHPVNYDLCGTTTGSPTKVRRKRAKRWPPPAPLATWAAGHSKITDQIQ